MQVFKTQPMDFVPIGECAAAYIEINDKLLFLQLSENKKNAKQWGVPAGKLEAGETPLMACKRELFEETGIAISEDSSVHYLGSLYIRRPDLDFIYHAFKVDLKSTPNVELSNKHTDYKWVSYEEAKTLDLLLGAAEALDFYCSHKNKFEEITKKEFYFVRHGQTDYNLFHYKINHPDVSLNECGKSQAKKIQPLIASLPINSICFSPLQRAKETKDILSSTLSANEWEIPQLGECTREIWDEMVSLGEQAINSSSELVKSFMKQIIEGVNLALNKEGPVLIVSHGGVHWALCCLMNVKHNWIVDNCVPVHFSYNEGKWEANQLSDYQDR